MRIEVPHDKKLTHEMVIPIRWGDMDAMGHVNNTLYFRYCEIVRIEWLHRFADLSSVEAFLDELAARSEEKGGPLVLKLARAPGSREPRWAQLLCGPVDAAAFVVSAQSEDFVAASELAALKAHQAALQAEVNELRALVERLYGELGVAR